MRLGYMAKDQYGQTYHLPNVKHPRKALLEKLGRKHCDKMYCDLKAGGSHQIGYIIAGLWLEVYEVHSWESEET